MHVLQKEGLLDARISAELQSGFMYWRRERRLCADMLAGRTIKIEDVLATSMLKSFDYRCAGD